jgi:hypothetical protein
MKLQFALTTPRNPVIIDRPVTEEELKIIGRYWDKESGKVYVEPGKLIVAQKDTVESLIEAILRDEKRQKECSQHEALCRENRIVPEPE